MPKNRDEKRVQQLKCERLGKIRYEWRTLLRLEYEKRYNLLSDKLKELYNDDTLTYERKRKKKRIVRREREILTSIRKRYPINCGICGDRMKNMVWNPIRHQWRCIPCYESAHEQFPEVYP